MFFFVFIVVALTCVLNIIKLTSLTFFHFGRKIFHDDTVLMMFTELIMKSSFVDVRLVDVLQNAKCMR